MHISSLSRRRSVLLSAAITSGAAAALVFGPVSPIGAIRNGGETCSSLSPNFRALDTRQGAGTRLSANTTIDVTVVDVGGVPADAKTVQVQLTATELIGIGETFLVAYPTGTARPPSSNLNPVDDHTTANGAQPVAVGTGGKITIYNDRGATHIIVDVVGWCDDHNHDNEYYKKSEVDSMLSSLQETMPFAETAFASAQFPLPAIPTSILSLPVTAPVDGQVTLNYTALINALVNDGDDGICVLAESDNIPANLNLAFDESVSAFEKEGDSDSGSVSGTRTFDISAGATVIYVLACQENGTGDGAEVRARNMTAVFTPVSSGASGSSKEPLVVPSADALPL